MGLGCVSLLCSVAGIVVAEDAGWSGKGEFGLVLTSGNTDTETLNLGLEFVREGEQWRHRIAADALRAEDSGNTTAERYAIEGQSDYKINEKSYAFGAIRYESDEFSAYEYQQTLALGYGRQLIDNEVHKLKGEIGPGLRRAEDAATGETESGLIIRGLLDYAWTVSETTTLTNRFLVESGSDNTFMENDAAISVAINDRFAMKFGFIIRRNSDVPVGVDETDTLTSANLVYNFQ